MIKRLAKCIREYKKDTILAPLFMVVEVVMEVLMPLLMAQLIDQGITGGEMSAILKIGLYLFLAALCSLAGGALSGKFAAQASTGLAKNMRRDIYHNIQSLSFSGIDRFSTSGLVTRLTTDVSNVQNAFQMIIRMAVRAPLMLILALISAFSISARLSLIFLCAIPILAGGIYLIMSHVHPVITKAIRLYDKLNSVVQENLKGIRVVKSFVREDHEVSKFKKVSTEIFTDFVKAERLIAFNGPLMQFCMYTCTLLISWFGAKMVVGGSLSTGQLMSLITYLTQILMSLMMLSMVLLMMVISRASAHRIDELLTAQSDIQNVKKPTFEVPDGSICFEDASFSYAGEGGKLCLIDIDLEIKSGQTVGILGGTGSGKTTLVQLIPRLYDVTKGTLLVGGVDVRKYDLETLRNNVAMVLQKNELFSGTIKENLRWGNKEATDEQTIHACKLAQADGFITSFLDGYDTVLEQGGSNLSGGQKQRLCIARALLKNPKILILDDSTSAVDTKTDALIRKAFLEEIPDVTKLIIAQRVASVQQADVIVVMDGGKIHAVGTHEQLLSSSHIYREVYQSQKKGEDENAA